jgi:hypothetical protein
MDETPRTPDAAASAFWSWLGFWAQILVLGVLAVVGAFAASGAARPGDYDCGMTLSLAAIALAFLKMRHQLDSGGCSVVDFLLVDDMPNLALAIPLFAGVGLAGLFIARAWESGDMHTAGVALFIASGVAVFLNIKHVFDRIDAGGGR